MKPDSSRFDEIAPDEGAQFLKHLDAALHSGTAGGPNKALAEFGARAAGQLEQDVPPAAPGELRARVERQLHAPPRGVARVSRLMARWRVGVLDLAALLVIGVLSVSLYFALHSKRERADAKSVRTTAEDGDHAKTPAPSPAPTPAPETIPDAADAGETADTGAYDADPDEPWAKALRAKLQEKVTVDFVDIPVEEAVAWLRTRLKIDIVIDPETLASGAQKTPLTFSANGMPAEDVLNWICRLADLQYGLKEQLLFISRKTGAMPAYDTEVYDISKTDMPLELLITLLHDRLFPADFADPATSVAAFKGKLLVTQRKSVQKRILHCLAVLGAQANAREITPITPPPHPAWMTELETALAKPLTFEFQDTDLPEALNFIRVQTGVTMVLSPKVLAAKPAPISLKVTQMKAKLALDWVLRLENLGWEYRDHALFIRDPSVSRELRLTIYNVGDLAESEEELNQLGTMVSRIAPETWDAAQGTSLEWRDHRLIAMNIPEVHAKIHDFLAKLRSTGIKPELPGTKAPVEKGGPDRY